MRRFVFTAFALTVFAACQPTTTELSEEQKAEIAAAVEAVFSEYKEAWERVDIDSGLSFMLDSPDVVTVGTGYLLRGFDDYNAGVRSSSWPSFTRAEYTITDMEITVLARDVACMQSVGSVVITDSVGTASEPSEFAYTRVWVHRNGEWKVLLTHGS